MYGNSVHSVSPTNKVKVSTNSETTKKVIL